MAAHPVNIPAMTTSCIPFAGRVCAVLGALFVAASAFAQSGPISLSVDATDAPRKILHARLRLPARPGPLTLLYPKWLPGEHAPNGPITDLVELQISAAGKALDWRRDPDDMYAFNVNVPAGAEAVE